MAPARIPDILSFMRFHELDPRRDNRCIYVTQKGSRCRYPGSNNNQAKKLYTLLIRYQDGNLDVEVLQDYIVSACCSSGRAQHRDRIEDVGLLPLLIQRWRGEIMAKIETQYSSNPATSTTIGVNVPSVLSEFRSHIAELKADDSVACKIQDKLEDRDFECGSLYIFNRTSSPGHVKIGWTAKSVRGRLEQWSRCGYVPNLQFSEENIPFAQRAETLAHYELIHEWRRERMCKADWCRKSHCEWFEVSVERAITVVRGWANLFQVASLYDRRGSLKPYWKSVVEKTIKDGGVMTGGMLLLHLPKPMLQPIKQMACAQLVKSMQLTKIEPEEAVRSMSPRTNEGNVPSHSISIKKQLSCRTSVPLCRSLSGPVSSLNNRFVTTIRRTKSVGSVPSHIVPGNTIQSDIETVQSFGLRKSPIQAILKTEPIIKRERFG